MRSPTTRAIVGLLLLSGVATWGAQQTGFLTGSVLQDELMQFQVQSPFATQENGVITIPAGTDVLLDWSRIDGKIFADDGLNMNGITDCVMFASRPIGPLTVEQPGGLANSPDAYSLMQMEYGVLPISGITAPVSFNLKCYNTTYQTLNSYAPVVSLTVQVNVGNVDTSVLQPYVHRPVTYPPVISPTTFTMTSGATVSGSDNILDVKPGSSVTVQWEQLEKGVNSGGCWLAFSQPVPGAVVDPSAILNSGWQDTYDSQYWSVKSTGSMTIPNMQASTTAMLWCYKPFGEYGTAYPYQMYRHIYVQPEPQCGDGKDNDANGKTDYPADTGCVSATDNVEYSAGTNNANQCVSNNPTFCGPKGCPAAFAGYDKHTYLRYDTAAGSWQDARAHCQAIGGDLATITSSQEQLFVFTNFMGGNRHDVWIGLTDAAAEGAFKWVDGTTPAYTNWDPQEPDNAGSTNNQDCGALSHLNFQRFDGKWSDGDCATGEGMNTGFLCEVPLDCGNTSDIVPPEPTAQNCSQGDPGYCGPQGCAGGLSTYGGHTYVRYDTPAGSWQDARSHCQTIGGDLVSITSAGEQSAVYNGLVGTNRSDLWIGLSDIAQEGLFKLVDGSTPTYTNWYPGNPDDGYSNEDCAEMNYGDYAHDGHWNDFPCDNGYGRVTGFICELPKDCGASSSSAVSSSSSSSASSVPKSQCNDGLDNDADGSIDSLVETSDPNGGKEKTFTAEDVRMAINSFGAPTTPSAIPATAAVSSTLETAVAFCEKMGMQIRSVAGVDKSYFSFFSPQYDTVAGKQYGWNGTAFTLNGDPHTQNLIWVKCATLSSIQCGDGMDNDGDGSKDFPSDAGCFTVNDNSELPHDLDCDSASDDSETGSKGNSANANQTPGGYGGIAFDGNDLVFMPLQNQNENQNGKVLVFGPSFKPAECGDGIPTSDEQCDDGNKVNGDGCNGACIWESYGSSGGNGNANGNGGYCGDGQCSLPEVPTSLMQQAYAPGNNWVLCPQDCDADPAVDLVLECEPGELCPDGSFCLNDGTCFREENDSSSSVSSSASSSRSSVRTSSRSSARSSSPVLLQECVPGQICPNNAICTDLGTCPGACVPGTLCPTGDICPENGLCPNACDPGSVCPNGAMCLQTGLCPAASSSSRSSQQFVAAETCFPGTLCADGQLCNEQGACPPALPAASSSSDASHAAAPLVDFSSCAQNLDCPSNLCIGGFCGCTTSDQCGGNACIGGFCTNIPAGAMVSLSLCMSNVECPAGMVCHDGNCEPNVAFCGNGRIDAGEICDDGNLIDNDSCSTRCLFANGSSCTNPRQCQSLICANGTCGACTSDLQCPDAMICTAGSCVPGSRSGVLADNVLIPSELARILATGTGFNLYDDGTTFEQYQAMLLGHGAPLASSGPESVAVMAAGASAGYTWMKLRRKKK